jgi:cholesterol transport system auxiliary component
MMRRVWLAGAAALAGCSVLPQQPYLQRRDWPLLARRPAALPPRTKGPVLLVRGVQAAPGLESRGLQWKLPDGSLHVDYYEQWAVPPAQAVEDALRLWLADAGLFAAVVAPGSQLPADLTLEGELTEFLGDPQAGVARAALALVLLDKRPQTVRVLLQKTEGATALLADTQPPVVVQALQAALEATLRETEQSLTSPALRAGEVEVRQHRG